MASIADVPLELVLDIVEYLKPYRFPIGSNEHLRYGASILESWHNFKEQAPYSEAPESDSQTAGENPDEASHGEEERKSTIDPKQYQRYSALRALRQTSRYFHEICTPLVYFELDIFPKKCIISAASSSVGQYAGHIRNLRIIMANPPNEDDREKYGFLIRQVLSLCTSTTSLTIYYDDLPAFRLRELGLVDAVVSLMSRGHLRSLEVSSIPARASTWWYNHPISLGLVDLIAGIIPLLDSSKELTALEITSESLSGNIYDEIRSKTIFLKSLTLRCCLAIALGRLWDQDQISKWAPNQNLTRLNLINCQNGYAPHLPNLVRHFSSLKHLFISACGDFSDVESLPRKAGWSQESKAFWRQRPPLDVLHIEHTLEWEIVAIGIIPTKTLIATSLVAGHLFGAFSLDEEIFPGLAVLKLDDIQSNILTDVESPDYHGQTDWERILTLRGVELKEGAQWLVNIRRLQQTY